MITNKIRKKFRSNEDCFMYWAEYKWQAGLSCSSCGCTEDVKGRAWSFKRKVQPVIEELHKQIVLFKKKHIYRFNKRNKQQWLFNEIIVAMKHNIQHPDSIILIV
jgi:hypothetical protein